MSIPKISHITLVDSFTGCDWTGSQWGCCTSLNPCGVAEGDCDSDDECSDDLICGTDNCPGIFPFNADCCIVE